MTGKSEQAEHLAQLLKLSYEPMLTWHLDGAIGFWNAGAERLYGFAPSEAIGRVSHSLLQTRFPTQLNEVRCQLLDQGYWSGELGHICKDGREVIVDSRMQLFGDDTVLEVNRDVTELRALSATQQLLIAELNHRVKNTLATVQAIVNQTLRRSIDPADFACNFAGRVQSLARIHSLLSDGGWRGTDLHALICDQLLQGPVEASRISVLGPSVELVPASAQRLATMLYELWTNAVKHGALSAITGTVKISWTVNDGILRLQWMERGGPTPITPTRSGFGRTFIDKSAKMDDGHANMVVDPEGIVWNVAMPLPQPRHETAKSSIIDSTSVASSDELAVPFDR